MSIFIAALKELQSASFVKTQAESIFALDKIERPQAGIRIT